MTVTADEISSQPAAWRRAAGLVPSLTGLPRPGERTLVLGCGTSWFMAQSYTSLRQARGLGVTDAELPTEMHPERGYDVAVAISRSGTTTEMVTALRTLQEQGIRTVLLTAVAGGPQAPYADHEIVLDFADERSVVQTVFATTVLALLRAHLGEDIEQVAADAEKVLAGEVPPAHVAADQITYLGRGWTIGLAHEAALKNREASQSWVESYPAMDYRHGPIAIAEPGRVVISFGEAPDGLREQVTDTGAEFVQDGLDPQASLVRAQQTAVARALARGLDPDRPRHLTRAVILP